MQCTVLCCTVVLFCTLSQSELNEFVVVCQGPQWTLLSDAEVKERFVVIEERKQRIIENKLRAQLREEKRQKSEELQSKLAEARMHRKLEQQGSL